MDAPATQFAFDAQATADVRATTASQAAEASSARATAQAAPHQTATAKIVIEATAQARPLLNYVQEVYSAGWLTATEGSYYKLSDLDVHWAQMGYYDFLLTDYILTDFVLRAEVAWESASVNTHWHDAGCGFVFRMNARGDHYLVLLGMDGWVYQYRKFDNSIRRLTRGQYQEGVLPNGSSQLALVVQGEWITILVDGFPVIRHQDNKLSTGILGYALASGTNEGFGTHCSMTNIELWELITP